MSQQNLENSKDDIVLRTQFIVYLYYGTCSDFLGSFDNAVIYFGLEIIIQRTESFYLRIYDVSHLTQS